MSLGEGGGAVTVGCRVRCLPGTKKGRRAHQFTRVFRRATVASGRVVDQVTERDYLKRKRISSMLVGLHSVVRRSLRSKGHIGVPRVNCLSLSMSLSVSRLGPSGGIETSCIDMENVGFHPGTSLLGGIGRRARFRGSLCASHSCPFSRSTLGRGVERCLRRGHSVGQGMLRARFCVHGRATLG